MNTFLFLSAIIAAAQGADLLHAAPYLVRAPAFAEVTPVISTLTHPVAETTHIHHPAPIATHQPAPIVQTHHVAQPIFKDVPIHQTFPVTGPVRTHQTVHQPIVHETRTHHVQQSVHTAAVPAVATVAHEVPVAVAGYAGHGYAGHAGLVGAGYAGHGLVGAGYAGHGLVGAGYAG